MRVAILCGGRTVEHDASMASGVEIARAAAAHGHNVRLVDPIAGDGRHWPRLDVFSALTSAPLVSELLRADVVVPAVHGGWGGDGHLQAMLEMAGVPFTGATSAACALAWHKPQALGVLRSAGVPTPPWSEWRHGREDPPDEVWRLLENGPLVVKEAVGTCQRTLQIAETSAQLRDACQNAHDGEALVVTPFLPGREFTVGIVGGRALAVVEIRLRQPLFDYEAKTREGAVERVCPAEIPAAFERQLVDHALTAHRALGLADRSYSRVDFRCDDAGRPMCLEVNASPRLQAGSEMGTAATGIGWSYPDLVERILDLPLAPAGTLVQLSG